MPQSHDTPREGNEDQEGLQQQQEKEGSESSPSIDELAALLSGEDPDAGKEPDAPEKGDRAKTGESQQKSAPKDLHELAERLGVEVKDLYGMQFPSADGESHTLGELKDMLAKQGEFAARELEWEEEKSRKESEMMRANQEFRELLSALPSAAIKPEILEKARKKHEAAVSVERQRTLEVIPEWNDEDKRNEELRGIVEHLKDYGLPENYLPQVFDHRIMRYMRDNMLRKKRVDAALERVKRKQPAALGKSKPAGSKPKRNPQSINRPTSRSQQRAVLVDLLKNG